MDNNLNNIKKMYDKLNYFDQYGGSIVLFIIITIIVIILITYFHTLINIQPIINDWPNQRCKPTIMPIAGLIMHPDGMTASEYTAQNFNYCTQNILSSITGSAVQPLSFTTNMLSSLASSIQEAIQSIRAMFDKVRNSIQTISEDIMGRIMNIMIPLQQIIISVKDLIGKIQGTMTAALFTLLGSYYTLQSLMGAIAQFIVIILITLAAMIAIFWLFPFTWGFAIANTAIFVAVAIPMAIILAFMVDVLKVNPNLSVPQLSVPSVKCFDKDTLIQMSDGTGIRIMDIQIGDKLLGDNIVTAKFKVTSEGSVMYLLDGTIVSDSHIVKYNNKWIPVCKHPNAIMLDDYYDEGYLYCLNTTNKTIQIQNTTFTDWDEIYEEKLDKVMKNNFKEINNTNLIHKYLDYGFSENTIIKLINGLTTKINELKLNDILENGEKVYGIVEIDSSDIGEYYRYDLGENNFVEGYAPNLSFSKENIKNNSAKKLFNILTDKKSYRLYNVIIPDYNNGIDRFLETN